MSTPGLAPILLDRLGEDVRHKAAAIPDLERRLQALAESALSRWPDLALSAEGFMDDLARILGPETEPEQILACVNAPELYLASACHRGDRRALACFCDVYMGEVRSAVASLRAPATVADEVEQIVSQKLFSAAPGSYPRIRDYAGRGSLRTWFRVIATRTAVTVLRKGARETPTPDDALLAVRAEDDDPELAALKRRCQADFKAAFEQAVTALEVRQRNLLRHQLVDELGVDEIAAIYRVHRVTASRWLAKARRDVWEGTRSRLTSRLGATSQELESLLRAIRTDLDLSLTRLLGDSAAREPRDAESG